MRILLTNDDGINAPGLVALERIARTLSDDIWVIAPEAEQSGVGHSRTLNTPLRLRKISEKHYAVNGTPTDCLYMAINEVLKDHKPDLVLSGVNYGANLAESITTSGTVAATIEATLFGIPAVAFSQDVKEPGNAAKFHTAEHFGPMVLKQLLLQKFPEKVLMNINFPDAEIGDVKGMRVTHQAQRLYESNLETRTDPRGKKYYWVGLLDFNCEQDDGTDIAAIAQNYISVTPLCLDLTHHETINNLKHVFI